MQNIPKHIRGHLFRRAQVTLTANTEVDVQAIKRHGEQKSSTIVEGFVVDSLYSKNKEANRILYIDAISVAFCQLVRPFG